MKRLTSTFLLIFLLAVVTVRCTPGPSPSPMLTTPKATTTQRFQTPSPTPTAPPTPMPTVAPSCPEPTEGTKLLRNEAMGYCFLYPNGYIRVDPLPYEICLVPSETNMLCHTAKFMLEVHDAAGRTATQIADETIANFENEVPGIVIERTDPTVSGEEAVDLKGLPGVDIIRNLYIVHADRLYMLTFIPWNETGEDFERQVSLYNTVINSFTFIPIVPSPASTEVNTDTGGSAVVVFVNVRKILVWEEATGQSRTIFDSGDVTRVELSDDGQLVAFLRRTYFEAGDFNRHEKSALWVVKRNGEDPRELVSADQLRTQLNASETDSTNFPRLEWIPNTHRLLYSGDTYTANGEGESAHVPTRGVYLVDADTLANTVLAPSEESFHFVPSPDGQQVALVSTTGLRFVDIASGQQKLSFPAKPIVGDKGWFTNAGVWTQDSSAFVINALVEPQSHLASDYALWRVPADGEPAAPLLTFAAGTGSVLFAPDGTAVAFIHGGVQVTTRFIVPLAEEFGPLAVPHDTFDYSHMTWSPDGLAFVLEGLVFDPQGAMQGRENLFPLCPNAVQEIEVCGAPIRLGEQIEWFEWIDRSRFLYVTYQPRQLYLGTLDGSATMLAEDPLSFAAVASTCQDDSEFVSDVSVPDGTPFAAGTVFQKTWRVRNTGDCAWDTSYRLTYLSGDRMSGPRSAPLGDAVQPGEEVDLSVMLIAPETAGTYQGQWQLFARDGTPFGTAPYVVIQVP